MNQTLRSAEDVLIASGQPRIYALAIRKESVLFEGKACPTAIREWLALHCPEVTIERIKKLDNCEPSADLPDSHKTVFCLGFNDEQAELFSSAWQSPPLDVLDPADDIYFVTVDSI